MVIRISISKLLAIFSIQVREKAKSDTSRRPAAIGVTSLRFSADLAFSRTRRAITLCNFDILIHTAIQDINTEGFTL